MFASHEKMATDRAYVTNTGGNQDLDNWTRKHYDEMNWFPAAMRTFKITDEPKLQNVELDL